MDEQVKKFLLDKIEEGNRSDVSMGVAIGFAAGLLLGILLMLPV